MADPVLEAKTLGPISETLVVLAELKSQLSATPEVQIEFAIGLQVGLMEEHLTTQVTDPVTFKNYVNEITADPVVAQVVREVGGTSFEKAIETTAQTLDQKATDENKTLQSTVTQIEKEIFSSSTLITSKVEESLLKTVQNEIQQIKEELSVSQISAVTVEVVVQTPATVPAPTTEPAPVPAPAVPAPEAPKVGL